MPVDDVNCTHTHTGSSFHGGTAIGVLPPIAIIFFQMFHWGLAANWPQTGPSLPSAHQMLIIPVIAYISDDFMKIITYL